MRAIHGRPAVAGNAFEATNTKLVVTNLRGQPRLEHQRTAHRIRRRCALERRDRRTCRQLGPTRLEHRGDCREGRSLRRQPASANSLGRSRVPNRPGPPGQPGAGRPTQPPQYQAKGEFTGNIRFAQQAGRITGEINATGQNVVLASLAAATANRTPRPPAVTKPSGKSPTSPSKAPRTTTPPPTASASTNSKSNRTRSKPPPRARFNNSPPSPNAT